MTAIEIIKKIENTSGNKAKELILATHKDNEDLQALLYHAFNPYLTYGIQKISVNSSINYAEDEVNGFLNILNVLSSKNVNSADHLMVSTFLVKVPEQTQKVFISILTKSLSIGMAAKSINKIIPNLIPTFDCMLAEPAGDLIMPLLVQEKLDGIRCITIKKNGIITFLTRTGNTIPLKKLKDILIEFPNDNFVLDGELLMSGELRQKTSGKINSLMKSGYKKEIDDKIEYHVFDFLTLEEWVSKTSLLLAFERAHEVLGISGILGYPFVPVEQTMADTEDDIKKFYENIRKDGGEGVIIKTNTPYEWKRSKNWGKLKAICSCTLTIVGFTDGEGKNKGKVGSITCESIDKKVVVNVNPRTDLDRDWFTDNISKCVGLPAEVLFNDLIKDEKGNYSLFLPRFATNWQRVDKFTADSLGDILKEAVSTL
jgi:DNA ligase-1